jgi:transcriptional regulator NrdR family protein
MEMTDKQQDAESGKGLRCPGCGCGHFETDKTVDISGKRRRRYKICRNCGRRVRTVEIIEQV